MRAQKFIASFRLYSHETGNTSVSDGGALPHVASNAEVQRWCTAGNILINGEKVAWDEEVDFPIISVVCFQNGKQVTLL